jgi:hypothetical protein
MRKLILAAILLAISVSVILHGQTRSVASQSTESQSQLNKVIQDVQKAELAGANADEIQGLLVQLNAVISLQDQLQHLGPEDSAKRADLEGQITSILATVDSQANQIEIVAAKMTLVNHIYGYSGGIIAAFLVTLAYNYGLLLWRKRRTKRIFQMIIIPK